MVCPCFSPFSGEMQESEHSFPAQRLVIEPTRRTAAVLSLPFFLIDAQVLSEVIRVIVSFF